MTRSSSVANHERTCPRCGGTMEADRPAGVLGSVWLAGLLTALVVALTVFTVTEATGALDVAQEPAGEAARIAAADARTGILVAAADLSERVLTYSHDSFDRDVEAASARLTPEFRQEYDSAMEKVRATTERYKISQEAPAVASAVISATADEAQALVFVNQETSSTRTRTDRPVRTRLIVHLVRVEGDWAVADLDPLG